MLFRLPAYGTLTFVNGLFWHLFDSSDFVIAEGLYTKTAELKMDDS